MKAKILILITIVILGGGYYWYTNIYSPAKEDQTQGTPAPGEEDVPEMIVGEGIVEATVEGSEYSFSPKTTTVKVGATVRLTFKNAGSTIHTLTIDELNADTGSVFPGSSKTIEFDAAQAGTYEFHCAVSGHKDSGMVGALVVE